MMPLFTAQSTADIYCNNGGLEISIDGWLRDALNHLRMSALDCRVAARTDLFEACALLSLDGEDAKRTFAVTFVKCFPNAANTQIRWYRPGVAEFSFDEAWVLRCLTSIANDDESSLRFLLRSKIATNDRRYIGYLLGQISEQFARI